MPDQDPGEILALLRAHLDRHGFGDVTATLAERPEWPSRVDPQDPWVQHPAAALEEVYGVPPVVAISSGDSGPVHPFVQELGLPVVMLGVGNSNSRVHSPNENILTHTTELTRRYGRWSDGQGSNR